MSAPIRFATLEGWSPRYVGLLAFLGFLILLGLGSALFMEEHGHYVTGMNNQIVWGMPHVFAVFLIVAASGALNVASIASVFSQYDYKPLSRLSALLAIALLMGGLSVLVLDLGRPDRLIVAMTSYNFKSIFAWNIFLYTGFMAIVAVYIWMMMERKMERFVKRAGTAAFIWRIILTTGTGSIFGFLVAREAYNSAVMAPMFVIMSLSFGTAFFMLVLFAAFNQRKPIDPALLARLRRLLGVFVAAVLYFSLVYHLTNLYITAHHGVEKFILAEGGIYTALFWIGQILLGGVLPLILLFSPGAHPRGEIITASVLILIGAVAQLYVIIIGGQAYPLELFPGMDVSSSFEDGGIHSYVPSLPEILLGIGGIAISMTLTALAVKVLPFLPESLAPQTSRAINIPVKVAK